MKLDRNIEGNEGRGKYAILNLRKLAQCVEPAAFGGLSPELAEALKLLEEEGILEWGDKPETEFFLIKLKDRFADAALRAYAKAAFHVDKEYAGEIETLSRRSGQYHPLSRCPD